MKCSCRPIKPKDKNKKKKKKKKPDKQEMGELEVEYTLNGQKIKVEAEVKKRCYWSPVLIKVPGIGKYGQPTTKRVRKKICL